MKHRFLLPYLQQMENANGLNQAGPSRKALILEALKSIVLNPILFMTVLGVIGGFMLGNLPPMIAGVLDVFGKSFSATALFLLGLRMVDSTKYFCGPQLLTPTVLILMKELVLAMPLKLKWKLKLFLSLKCIFFGCNLNDRLVLPLVIRQTVNIIHPGNSYAETTDLSTFGFLYGTFPAGKWFRYLVGGKSRPWVSLKPM